MKYLKYFESDTFNTSILNIDVVKDKIDYIAQTLIDDYDGETDIKQRVSKNRSGFKGTLLHGYKYIKYYLKLDMNSILTDEYKDTIRELNNNDIELPHSRYDIYKTDFLFSDEKGWIIHSNLRKSLNDTDQAEDIYESTIFKPEFIKELKKFNRGLKDEFDKRTIEGDPITHYDICLSDMTDIAQINILLY